MTTQHLVLVSGFAKSGKSTLANQLKHNGIAYASSSDILSRDTLTYYGLLPVTERTMTILETKNESLFKLHLEKYCPFINSSSGEKAEAIAAAKRGIRAAKIFVAEEVIVPKYGRKYFAEECFRSLPLDNDELCVIFTTIPKEHEEFMKLIEREYSGRVTLLNLRSQTEERGVDKRELFDTDKYFGYRVKELWNYKIAPEQTFIDFLQAIE